MLKLVQHVIEGKEEQIPGVPLGKQKIVFIDPPYNIGVKYADDPTGDKLSLPHYQDWCQMVMYVATRHLCPGGTLWWLCPPAHSDWIGHLLSEWVGPRLYLIVKTESFAQYQQKTLTEDYRLLYCHVKPAGPTEDPQKWGKDLLTFNPEAIRVKSKRQELGDKRADPRGRVPGQVWAIRRLQGTSNDHVDWHPCQLAPELLERIVLGWSNPGDSVLDAFAGSGNMGLVCRRHGRDFIGVDGSPTYIEKMKVRLQI